MNQGLLLAASAYIFWGLIPLYWKQLPVASPWEMLVMRIIWGLPIVAAWMLLSGQSTQLKKVFKEFHTLKWLLASTTLIAINWFTFVWAVFNNHLLESALGYYINPLFNVLLGTVFLQEKLRKPQWTSVFMATIGVVVLGFGEWHRSLIAFTLAMTFALYGFCRKKAQIPSQVGVTFELGILFIPSVLGLICLNQNQMLTFSHAQLGTQFNLALAGPITIFPLVLFSFAIAKLKLSTMGIIQYITPTLHFALGYWLYKEQLDPQRLAAFALIWPAVALYLSDEIYYQKNKKGKALLWKA